MPLLRRYSVDGRNEGARIAGGDYTKAARGANARAKRMAAFIGMHSLEMKICVSIAIFGVR